MRWYSILFAILVMNLSSVSAQFDISELPRNIRTAYEKGTRSIDGKPGAKYWQNSTDYDIKVTLVTSDFLIKGAEKITYYNNSPDTLNQIVIRLYPDLYRKGAARDFDTGSFDLHDGVDILRLVIEDEEVYVDGTESPVTRNETNMFVTLPNALLPGDELAIHLDWRYRVPRKRPIRTGAYSDSSFFIAYWYPQIAVYDDIDGWDKINYSGTQEFYNDFANFNVEISVRNDFLVWATGVLQNADEILSENVYERYNAARQADSVVRIISANDLKEKTYSKINSGRNTWRFKAKNVPDFAFAASNFYLWDGVSVQADPVTGRTVFVQSVYPESSPDFPQVAKISKDIIDYFSRIFPAVPYPYPEMTAFNRQTTGGGMEYPMMINDGSYDNHGRTARLAAHEIAHTYFPFFTGINERKYAFMDEGWAHMFPFVMQPVVGPAIDPLSESIKDYTAVAGNETEMPMMIPSNLFSGKTYRMAAYNRPGLAYFILRDVLGAEKFDQALREFITRWQGKHPIPYDFFFTFNASTGQDLNWFWKPWFFEHGYPDLALGDISFQDGQIRIEVQKVGNLPVPVQVQVDFKDNTKEVLYETAAVWKNGGKKIVLSVPENGGIKKIELGAAHIPDVESDNNIFLSPQQE